MSEDDNGRIDFRFGRVTRGQPASTERIAELRARLLQAEKPAVRPIKEPFGKVLARRQSSERDRRQAVTEAPRLPDKPQGLSSTPRGLRHPADKQNFGVRTAVKVVVKG